MALLDGTKLKGYISEAGEDSFVVVTKSNASIRTTYSQVKQIKGTGLSIGKKVLIWLGTAAGVLLLLELIIDD